MPSGKARAVRKKNLPPAAERDMTPKLRARVDKATGRDITYLPDTARVVCARLEAGDGLHKICAEPGMPPVSTVRHWARDPDLPFGEMLQTAFETARSKWAEDILELSDTSPENRDVIKKRQMQIDSRKWLLEKLDPVFANRRELTGRGGGPIAIVTREMSDIELAREVAFMLNRPKVHAPLDLKAEDITDIEAG
jgi:hypothetical protein